MKQAAVFPGQLVPIISPAHLSKFKRRVVVDDNYLYLYKDRVADVLHQYVISGMLDNDQQFVKILLEKGAVVKENYIKVPNYSSWATIDPGVKLELNDENFKLEYIPKKSVCCNDKVSNDLQDSVQTRKLNEATYMITDDVKHSMLKVVERYFKSNRLFCTKNKSIGVEQLLDVSIKHHNKKWKVQCGYDDLFSLINGQILKENHKHWDELYISLKTVKNILDSPCQKTESFILFPNNLNVTVSLSITPSKRIWKKNNQWNKVDKHMYQPKNIWREEEIQKAFLQIISESKLGPVNIFKTANKKAIMIKLLKEAFEKFFQGSLTEKNKNLVNQIIQELAFWGQIEQSNFCFKTLKTQVIQNYAPYSEKGKLKVSFSNPECFEDVVNYLAQIGVISSFVLPQKQIGLVKPICEKSQKNPLKLPLGRSIIHGMTGVETPDKAYYRLKEMIKQEGILSYRERRRLDINNHTMSPIGDMASSLDWAVPATINSFPTYGKHIFFIITPQSLNRKHMFFSNTDFGGGYDRFSSYDQYAASLGQKSFLSPPTREQKEAHLKKVARMKLNEIWFKDSIAWHEITHILVTESDGIDRKVKEIITSNSITQHIKVVSFKPKTHSMDNNKPCQSPHLKRIIFNLSVNRIHTPKNIISPSVTLAQLQQDKEDGNFSNQNSSKEIDKIEYFTHELEEYFELLSQLVEDNYS